MDKWESEECVSDTTPYREVSSMYCQKGFYFQHKGVLETSNYRLGPVYGIIIGQSSDCGILFIPFHLLQEGGCYFYWTAWLIAELKLQSEECAQNESEWN